MFAADEAGIPDEAILASTGDDTTLGSLDLRGDNEATEDPLKEEEETRVNVQLEGSRAIHMADAVSWKLLQELQTPLSRLTTSTSHQTHFSSS